MNESNTSEAREDLFSMAEVTNLEQNQELGV